RARTSPISIPCRPYAKIAPSFCKSPTGQESMKQYLDLVRHVLTQGVKKPQRAVLESTWRRPDVYSVFGYQMRIDLTEGFPLLTTKRLRFDWIAHELIWFLRGDTNTAYLKQH